MSIFYRFIVELHMTTFY